MEIKKYQNLNHFVENINQLIDQKNYGKSLMAIKEYVESIINNKRSVAKILSCKELDALCVRLGKKTPKKSSTSYNSVEVVYETIIVLSEITTVGGHIELLKDILREKIFGSKYLIIVTDIFNRNKLEIINFFSDYINVDIKYSEDINFEDKYYWLLNQLKIFNPSTVVLMVHNQDSVGVAAVSACDIEEKIFIHHGDFLLSLGVTIREFIHVDLTSRSYNCCREELGLCSRYMPLVNIQKISFDKKKEVLISKYLTTCSSGREDKFIDRNYLFSYADVIARIILATKGRHIHIGPISRNFKDSIEAKLKEKGVDVDRFIHIDRVESLSQSLRDLNVDLYISSFPLAGGKSTVEAMAAGIPLLMHKNYYSQRLSAIDIAYKESWKWGCIEELDQVMGEINKDSLIAHSNYSLEHYRKYYTVDGLRNFKLTKGQEFESIPPIVNYKLNEVQSFIDTENGISDEYSLVLLELNKYKEEWKRNNDERIKLLKILKDLNAND